MIDEMPEEDRLLAQHLKTCTHDWVDLYGGTGTDRINVNYFWVYFFCKKCLETKSVKLSQSMMRLNDDFEEEREEKGL